VSLLGSPRGLLGLQLAADLWRRSRVFFFVFSGCFLREKKTFTAHVFHLNFFALGQDKPLPSPTILSKELSYCSYFVFSRTEGKSGLLE
jgi:hypothetical protein